MKRKETFFWYDLETFGLDSRHDRIAQFAGVRTDSNLKEIEEPYVWYCRLSDDYLPDPLACMITHITPQEVAEKGMIESEFIAKINEVLSVPGTCTVGYNSLRFDDEFLRNTLFRNFLDPYRREYDKGNSRWDILDLARAARDLRPKGINWPTKAETGNPSFKLTNLTQANGIAHTQAHDALSDVYATLELARLIKRHQPKLFSYYLTLRNKQTVKTLLPTMGEPLALTAAPFTRNEGCTTVVIPITASMRNPNSIIVFDLMQDPAALINASRAFGELESIQKTGDTFRIAAQQVRKAIQTGEKIEEVLNKSAELLTDGANLLTSLPQIVSASDQLLQVKGLHRIAINRAPFLSPLSVLTEETISRLAINMTQCQEHYEKLITHPIIAVNVRKAVDAEEFPVVDDVDHTLYSGSFFSDADAKRFSEIRSLPPEELWAKRFNFDDQRAHEMLWRYQCRNWPEVVSEEEKERWKSFCAQRLIQPPGKTPVTLEFFARKIAERMASNDTTPQDKEVLSKLEEWGRDLCTRIGLTYPR